jgi:hypothetical protein
VTNRKGRIMAVRQTTNARYHYERQMPPASRKVSNRRKPKLKFYLILLAVVAVAAVTLILVLRGQPTAAVEWASTDFSAKYDMLVLRDEVVYEAKNYGKTDFIAVEGQHVDIGDPIVEVYEWGYNDETLSILLDLQKKILTYQTDVRLAGIIDEQLNDINKRIDAKGQEIQQAVADGKLINTLPLEREMDSLLDERMTYLKTSVMQDEPLAEYYSQENELLQQIAGWRTSINAKETGTVSFYFDGCEALMTKENIGHFTKKSLQEVEAGKTVKTEEEDQATAPLYRVVNENEFYVVMMSDKKIPEMYVGNNFSLVFDDYLDKQYTGVVFNVSDLENNDGYVYTILIKDNIGPLLGDRRVSAKVYNVQQGFRVPAGCIKTSDGVDYVETAGGQVVPVMVMADDGDYKFVQTYEGQPGLEVGQLIKK